MSNKVVIIGLDAACFERIDPFLEEGKLPNLQRLLDRGGGTDMETTTPPWTPSAWPSIVTGTEPQTHGVYDFFNHDTSYGQELVSARNIQVPYLWEHLSERGLSSIVVNVPVTHPAHDIDGSLIPGYLAPEDPICLIDGEARSLSDYDPEYRIYADNNDATDETLKEYEELIRSRESIAKRLADLHDWSFLMVQFQRTDSVYHTFGDEEAASHVYSTVDDAIGSLLDHIDDAANVLVVSDHGIWQYKSIFYINSWLKENGYLDTTTESTRIGWNANTKQKLKGEDDRENRPTSAKVSEILVKSLNRLGLSPQLAKSILATVGLDTFVKKHIPLDALEDSIHHVSWSESEVYCRSPSGLGIRFNVKGRENKGVISPEAFGAMRKRLIEELETLESPSGDSIFEEVWDRHTSWGTDIPNESSAPDILYRPRDMKWEISDIVKKNAFESTDVYNHNYRGLLIAAGPDITWDDSIQPHVTDVAPTVLSLLNISPPDEMDGAVLKNITSRDVSDQCPPTPSSRRYLSDTSSVETSDVVEDRLRDMGYMK